MRRMDRIQKVKRERERDRNMGGGGRAGGSVNSYIGAGSMLCG